MTQNILKTFPRDVHVWADYLGLFAQMLLLSLGIVFIASRFWALRTICAAPSIGIKHAATGLLVSRA